MPRIFTPDPLAAEGLAILERTPGFEIDKRSGLKGVELKAALAEADGVIVRSGTTLTAELLQGLTRLRAIVRAGVGVDNIDVPAATRAGIVVMNTPGGNTLSTAEHTWALLLSLCRHVPAADATMRAGKWDRKSFVGRQLAGKTLGVIGLGRVGLAVAKRGVAFEMKTIGFDPFMTPERAAEHGIELVKDLEDLYPRVDALTVHVPLSPETEGLVGAAQMAKLPKGAIVVNCARGGIVDEAALAAALESGHLAGAAIDVFAEEPPKDSPFAKLKTTVVTPHLGASTAEAQVNVSIEAANLLADFFNHGNVRFAVNMVSLEASELAETRRHADIAYRLGLLQAQVSKGPVRKALVEYRGAATKQKTKIMTAAFTMGLLKHAIPDANLINATLLAEERGLAITEQTSSEPTDFATLIRTVVETDRDSSEASGTTRGATFNRLVRLGPFRMDAFLEGTMLIFHHNDRPGIIGHVGTVLGNHDVNIAQMTVGRREAGGNAVGVLAVDAAPSDAALEELRRDSRIIDLRVVRLPEHGVLPAGV
jgi:D-3-phosphoglycerate dehydrogenase